MKNSWIPKSNNNKNHRNLFIQLYLIITKLQQQQKEQEQRHLNKNKTKNKDCKSLQTAFQTKESNQNLINTSSTKLKYLKNIKKKSQENVLIGLRYQREGWVSYLHIKIFVNYTQSSKCFKNLRYQYEYSSSMINQLDCFVNTLSIILQVIFVLHLS